MNCKNYTTEEIIKINGAIDAIECYCHHYSCYTCPMGNCDGKCTIENKFKEMDEIIKKHRKK